MSADSAACVLCPTLTSPLLGELPVRAIEKRLWRGGPVGEAQ